MQEMAKTELDQYLESKMGYLNFVPVDYSAIWPGYILLELWDGEKPVDDELKRSRDYTANNVIWIECTFLDKYNGNAIFLPINNQAYYMPIEGCSYHGNGVYEIDHCIVTLYPDFINTGKVKLTHSTRSRDDTIDTIGILERGTHTRNYPLYMKQTYRFNAMVILEESDIYIVKIFNGNQELLVKLNYYNYLKYFFL